MIKDFDTYEQFDEVILFHGVRYVSELAYRRSITETLPNDEIFGEMVRGQLRYYPAVTREEFPHRGRVTDLIRNGQLFEDLGIEPLDPATDRAMVCGNPAMLSDTCSLLDSKGMTISPRRGEQGDYLIERAFVER